MTYETLKVVEDDGWLTICLNRPEARNALSEEMVIELMTALKKAASDDTLRGVTLRGEGAVFCAGGDLNVLIARRDRLCPAPVSAREEF